MNQAQKLWLGFRNLSMIQKRTTKLSVDARDRHAQPVHSCPDSDTSGPQLRNGERATRAHRGSVNKFQRNQTSSVRVTWRAEESGCGRRRAVWTVGRAGMGQAALEGPQNPEVSPNGLLMKSPSRFT